MDGLITTLLYPDRHPAEALDHDLREVYVRGLAELLHEIEPSNKTARTALFILAQKLSVSISPELWETAQTGMTKKAQKTRLRRFCFWSMAPYFWWDFYRIASISGINFSYPMAKKVVDKKTNRFYRKYRIAANNLFVSGENAGILPSELVDIALLHKEFASKTPRRLLVVGTMSSGKSTFINSIVGKKIVKVKTTVCTTSVTKIYNRPQEGQIVYANDKECLLNTDGTIPEVSYPKIALSFAGTLANKQVVLIDTPGVNYAYDANHKAITKAAIEAEDYDAIICVVNSTYIESIDTSEMIDMLPKGENKKIIFVLNQLDRFVPKDDSIEETIGKFKAILKDKRISAEIAPYSAEAAYLLKKETSKEVMSKIEKNSLTIFKKLMNAPFYNLWAYATGNSSTETDFYARTGLTFIETLINEL